MLRFIHCADLHFDRSFEGLSASNQEQPKLVEYNQLTLKKIVDEAIHAAVDFVLLVGDTFHQNKPTLKTQRLFFEEMHRLEQHKIPVYLSFGNHDYYDESRYWFEFPENVHLFKEEQVQTVQGTTVNNETYSISAFSYRSPWIEQSKVKEFPPRELSDYHIGMYHGEVGLNRYAPFQPSEMIKKGYDYWALGHIHVSTILQENPPILYPGTPTGHTKKEIKTNGIAMVTLNKQKSPNIEFIHVASVQWETMEIALHHIQSLKEVVPVLKRELTKLSSTQPTFIQIKVKNTEQLPSDWLTKSEAKELIAVLNEEAILSKRWVYAISEIASEKVNESGLIHCEESEVIQLKNYYEEEHHFHESLEELWTQPSLTQLLKNSTFKDAVLTKVSERLSSEITIKGGD